MKKLALIRHAPPLKSETLKFIGQSDVPADPAALIELLGSFRLFSPEMVISSPLARAKSTAIAIFGGMTSIETEMDLRERSLGQWEGIEKDVVRKKFPEMFHATGKLRCNVTPPDAESIDDLVTRVKRFINKHVEHSNENLVAVTHNGVIAAARHILLNIPIDIAYSETTPHLTPVIFTIDSA